jgi:hypothetical protein
MLGAMGEVQDLAGNVYIGQWEGDRKHGYGRCVWSDGYVYEGNWEENAHSQSGGRASTPTATGMRAQYSGGLATPTGRVLNMQEGTSYPDFDFARAAGELTGTWFDALTGGGPSPARAVHKGFRGRRAGSGSADPARVR